MNGSHSSLSLPWRALRLATTLLVLMIASLFIVGSAMPAFRLNCCATDAGMTCTSCGITRSVSEVLHGEIEGSKTSHRGGLLLVGFVAASLLLRPLPYILQIPWVITMDAIGFVGGWVALGLVLFGIPGSGYGKNSRAEQDAAGQPPLAALSSMISRNSNPTNHFDARPR